MFNVGSLARDPTLRDAVAARRQVIKIKYNV